MRKFGLIAAIVGLGVLALALLLGTLADRGSWMWFPGFVLLAGGSALFAFARPQAAVALSAAPKPRMAPSALKTSRLLDDFERRFTELKGRKPSPAVLGDLYSLGMQLERHGRGSQATAVYRHLARFDDSYRDVPARLRRLTDTARKTAAPPIKVASPAQPARTAKPAPATEPAAGAAECVVHNLGRYQLEREIGRGAMGVVYLGRDTAINRLVAIKAIPLATEFLDGELDDARARFFREAETAGRLNHPNIVTIYDVGEERGLAYIAMEYLKGRHLSDYSTYGNLMEPRKVLDLMARVADALGFAHRQQVVHRDIKPANLMYDEGTDILKITDFGIARLTGSGSTRTGIVLGTPSFMSPEQLEGRSVNGHSDLFSLGVSLFQLLTGQLPFVADSMTGLMRQIAEVPHPPLRALRPELPPCVETVIDRALAKNPEARFDSGAEMATALEDCRSRIPSGMP
jgi:serine/threonine-protein kinase